MVKSIDRITRIFKLASSENNGLTNAHIAKSLGVPKSTLSAFLQDLVSNGYLALDPASKEYRLGPLFLIIAGKYLRDLDIAKVSQPYLKELAKMTGESTGIAISKGLDMLLVAKENSPQPILHLMEIGQTAPLYATASGKLFLAYRSDREIDEYITAVERVRFTSQTILDDDTLWREIKEIQAGRLGYNRREFSNLTISIAAPVFDLRGALAGSLVVMAPEFRINNEQKLKMIDKALRTMSVMISKELGFGTTDNPIQSANRETSEGGMNDGFEIKG